MSNETANTPTKQAVPESGNQIELDYLVTFNAQDYTKIIEKAEIVNFKHSLSAKAQQLMQIILSKIDHKNPNIANTAYKITADEVVNYMGLTDRNDVVTVWREAYQELLDNTVRLKAWDEKKQRYYVTDSNWISDAGWEENSKGEVMLNDGFVVSLPPKLHVYYSTVIKSMGGRYLKTELIVASQLARSRFSLRMYKIIKDKALSVVTGKKLNIAIDINYTDICETLMIPKSYTFSKVKERVIDLTIEEMNDVSELHCTFVPPKVEMIMKGGKLVKAKKRKATSYQILVSKNPNYKESMPSTGNIKDIKIPKEWGDGTKQVFFHLCKETRIDSKLCFLWIGGIPLSVLKGLIVRIQDNLNTPEFKDENVTEYYTQMISAVYTKYSELGMDF